MRNLNVAPWADMSTMPGRAITEVWRKAYLRKDGSWVGSRTPEAMKWWHEVWLSTEVMIEDRLDSARS